MCLFCETQGSKCCQYYERNKELCEFLLLKPNQNLTQEETRFCLQAKDMPFAELGFHMVTFLQEKLKKIKSTNRN
jgi:hypothetical protein